MFTLQRHLPGIVFLFLLAICPGGAMAVDSEQPLPLEEFIQLATANDPAFEAILIDRLALQHRRDALLPDRDLILEIKQQHNFYIDQDRNSPATSLSLSKLFPFSGAEVSLSYGKAYSTTSALDESTLQFLVSQPIARNAFGKGLKMRDKIIGIENEVLRYQVTEAYEDYLASLTAAYYNWYSAYESLKVGTASYASSQKLLANILERQRQKIALPIDVNKMQLALAGKKENMIVLQEIYDSLSNLVLKATGNKGGVTFIPVQPKSPVDNVQFERDYQQFTDTSRTYRVLRLLEQQGTMEVAKAADDLLPSTNLLLGYQVDGEDWGIRNPDRSYFAGLSLQWPIGRSVDKARHQIAKIQQKKTVLSNRNKYEELRTNLKNLYQQILREQELIAVSRNKLRLAEAILRDETENYSFGKVTLNDYIFAVNSVDENRFKLTERTVARNKLMVEWLRLTDRLVDEAGLKKSLPHAQP